ncbi:MAG: DUF4202 domain-containing protein, partial [Proteobacteria bacterium]|nr:DUF4202 domain-containing protein [Pseudomonadota bacterium]
MTNPSQRFQDALDRFDQAHREDPKTVVARGAEVQWSLLYHRRLSHWVGALDGQASEALRLAARCQHLRRWTIPRSDFPEGVTGYKRWRNRLAQFHADAAAAVLQDVGYEEAVIARVRDLLIKKSLKRDPEVQLFEDAICLTFLENEFASFAAKHDEDKLVNIVRKTWRKMSATGHRKALELAAQLPEPQRNLIEKALAPR